LLHNEQARREVCRFPINIGKRASHHLMVPTLINVSALSEARFPAPCTADNFTPPFWM
jgi:hypothetical protein